MGRRIRERREDRERGAEMRESEGRLTDGDLATVADLLNSYDLEEAARASHSPAASGVGNTMALTLEDQALSDHRGIAMPPGSRIDPNYQEPTLENGRLTDRDIAGVASLDPASLGPKGGK